MTWHPLGGRRWERLGLQLPVADATPPKAPDTRRFFVRGEPVDAVDEAAAVMWSDSEWGPAP